MTTAGKVFGALALLVAVLALGFVVGKQNKKQEEKNYYVCSDGDGKLETVQDRQVCEYAALIRGLEAQDQSINNRIDDLHKLIKARDQRIRQLNERIDSLARISYRQWSASHGSAKMENPNEANTPNGK